MTGSPDAGYSRVHVRRRTVRYSDRMELSWLFARGSSTLQLSRSGDPDARRLSVTGPARSRLFDFATHEALVAFQVRLERHLVRTGWRFVSFSPERRSRAQAVAHAERRVLSFPSRADDSD